MKENYSILLVDDDPDDHYFFRDALKKVNVPSSLTSVHTGAEAMDLLLKKGRYANDTLKNPDLIVLDLNMPLLTGFDVLHQIKSNTKISGIPVYILSTSQDAADSKRVLDMGASGFYGKPGSAVKLHQIIVEMLITL